MSRVCSNHVAAKPETRRTLPKVLVLSMLPHFLAPILPRLLFIAFCYAQPVLISTAIRFISQPPLQSSETGYPIILMAVIIYVGLAVCYMAVCVHLTSNLRFRYQEPGINTASTGSRL